MLISIEGRLSGSQVGRRSRVLDDLVLARIAEATRAGLGITATADYAGISRSTYFEWMRRGRAAQEALDLGLSIEPSDQLYLDFLDEIRRLRASAQIDALGVIEQAAFRGDWKAAAWFLERSDPDDWGPIQHRQRASNPATSPDPAELEKKVLRILDQRRLASEESNKSPSDAAEWVRPSESSK